MALTRMQQQWDGGSQFRRQPTTLGALASQPPAVPDNGFGTTGFSSLNGAAPGVAPGMARAPVTRTHSQPAPTTITDGRQGNTWGRTAPRNGGPDRWQGWVNPNAPTSAMADLYRTGNDATRSAMIQDMSPMMANRLLSQFGNANELMARYGRGGDMTGSTYTPGQFGEASSNMAQWMPGGSRAPNTIGGAPTLPTGGAAGVGSGNTTPGMGSPGYGVNVSDYLDPSMDFQMGEGLRALQNSAAARGNLGSGSTLRDILRYSQGLASTEYGNAFNRASNVRDFSYGVDRDDRNFDYGVARDDRNFDYSRLRDLANWGMQGTNAATSGSNVISGLIASLINNQGQIQGSGAIGGSNAVNSGISQILNQILQQQILGQLGKA